MHLGATLLDSSGGDSQGPTNGADALPGPTLVGPQIASSLSIPEQRI